MKYFINIFSNLIKVISGFLFFLMITKYNSVEAVGQLGQLLTFSAATMMVATLGIQNKVIQDVSKNLERLDSNYIASMVLISLFFLTLILISGKLFFYNISLSYGIASNIVFYIFVSLTFIIATLLQFKIAIYNGTGDYKKLASINIFGSITAIFVTYIFLDVFNQMNNQFFLLMLYPCIKILFIFFPKDQSLYANFFLKNINRNLIASNIRSMLPFIVMATVSVFTIYGYQYSVRNLISLEVNWNLVGQWQILQKHSEIASLFFTSIAAVFIIPKLAGKKFQDQLVISKKFAILLLMGGVIGLTIVRLIGVYYVEGLFGSEYTLAGSLLFIHLVGDFFKIIAYCFSLIVLCNSWVKTYIVMELTQYILLFLSYYLCFIYFSENFMAYSYALTYFLYMIGVVVYLFKFKEIIYFFRLR
tara:strand:- start:5649 stop:6902 length:1254 start_codon:yes stop_codon:yes gene_type:complete